MVADIRGRILGTQRNKRNFATEEKYKDGHTGGCQYLSQSKIAFINMDSIIRKNGSGALSFRVLPWIPWQKKIYLLNQIILPNSSN